MKGLIFLKVHLTPKRFFTKTNLLVTKPPSAKNKLDLDESPIFCAPTKSLATAFEENGSSGCCDVYPVITGAPDDRFLSNAFKDVRAKIFHSIDFF